MKLLVMERIWIILLSLLGIGISLYIYYKRTRGEKLACLLGGDHCTEVVMSKYGWTFRVVPNEVVGLGYYILVILLTTITFAYSQPLLVASSFLAFIFSVYVTYIQLFTLRNICEWCLVANGINVILFLLIAF